MGLVCVCGHSLEDHYVNLESPGECFGREDPRGEVFCICLDFIEDLGRARDEN